MSYISNPRHAATAVQLSSPLSHSEETAVSASPLAFANTRVSEALEVTILVATLSGVSLVLSTIAAGAF